MKKYWTTSMTATKLNWFTSSSYKDLIIKYHITKSK